jgi:2-amino-4-hydroxy-6-hydroxymethyldihydropteridine diphosphokinase
MARVYLGIGSNVEPERNLRLAVRELRQRFGKLDLSPVYRNPPLGFEGDDFLNAVIGLDTGLAPDELLRRMEDIHAAAGRRRDARKLVSRTLDIDLLLYDRLVVDEPGLRLPRSDVLRYNFVLRPLAELAPEVIHPVTGERLAEHWRRFQADAEGEGACRHPLTEVAIDL